MHLTVDQRVCGTTGQCGLMAPELFRQRADGVAEVIDPDPPESQHENAREAAHSRPVNAILAEGS
jgi:ferredoxin